jgi:hypothetical protein
MRGESRQLAKALASTAVGLVVGLALRPSWPVLIAVVVGVAVVTLAILEGLDRTIGAGRSR